MTIFIVFAFPALSCQSSRLQQQAGQGESMKAHPCRFEHIKVGMTYVEIVELLGEPELSVGFGELVTWWKLDNGNWFHPTFEGDRVVKVEFTSDPPIRELPP